MSKDLREVLPVHRDEMMSLAGLPWEEAIRGRKTKRVEYFGVGKDDVPERDWAFLREVDGRAFLYRQNW